MSNHTASVPALSHASFRFTWASGEKTQRLVTPCPFCGALAVVALTPALLAIQPDDTTHVCHPTLGGCNHGFAVGAKDGV